MERAVFVGGYFRYMIQPFDTLPGVHTVVSGYTGGHVPDPTYEQVKSQTTGHTEAVKIICDPTLISYERLVGLYWQQTDPTDAFKQFEDRGDNYRLVIFYLTEKQRIIVEKSKRQLAESGRFKQPIITKIEPTQPFYLAGENHQKYYKKHPENFKGNHVRRATPTEENWGSEG